MRGSSPRPVNVDESVNGALLGCESLWDEAGGKGRSTFGLKENKEDMICVPVRTDDIDTT